MIELKDFCKTYDGVKNAVDHLSFTVKSGEIFGFIGHNGAGKTTTLRCIVGIQDFEAGEILIDGHSIQQEPIICKQHMAYLPDNPDLYENMKAIDFINFVCDVYKVDLATRTANLEKYTTVFDLSGKLNQPIASFSHGMKQKVALIAALVHEPDILVMDEPFVGLDPKAVYDMKTIMKEMAHQGKTIIFSTHILDVAEKLCDHVAIIKHGKLIKSGSMKAIKGDKSLEKVFLEDIA